MPARDAAPRPFLLARLALVLVVTVITLASLRPFHGWRDPGRHPLAFLVNGGDVGALFDEVLNVVGYVPFGACLVLALFPRVRGARAGLAGALVPALFSLGVEVAQNYLPERVASVIDWGMNSLGAALGAGVATALAAWLADHRGGRQIRARWLAQGLAGEIGLLLLAVWCVAAFAQRAILFGSGDFRGNFEVPVDWGVPPTVYGLTEMAVVVVNLLAAALLLRLVLAESAPRFRAWLAMVVLALVARQVAQLAFWPAGAAFQWVSPAAMAGCAVALALVPAVLRLSRPAAARVALLLLVLCVVVVNVAPPDPALWLAPTPPRERLLIGLTLVGRYTAKAWPFLAAAYVAFLLAAGRRR